MGWKSVSFLGVLLILCAVQTVIAMTITASTNFPLTDDDNATTAPSSPSPSPQPPTSPSSPPPASETASFSTVSVKAVNEKDDKMDLFLVSGIASGMTLGVILVVVLVLLAVLWCRGWVLPCPAYPPGSSARLVELQTPEQIDCAPGDSGRKKKTTQPGRADKPTSAAAAKAAATPNNSDAKKAEWAESLSQENTYDPLNEWVPEVYENPIADDTVSGARPPQGNIALPQQSQPEGQNSAENTNNCLYENFSSTAPPSKKQRKPPPTRSEVKKPKQPTATADEDNVYMDMSAGILNMKGTLPAPK